MFVAKAWFDMDSFVTGVVPGGAFDRLGDNGETDIGVIDCKLVDTSTATSLFGDLGDRGGVCAAGANAFEGPVT